jgi:hypothetical protein
MDTEGALKLSLRHVRVCARIAIAVFAATAAVAAERPARACGGCFAPPRQVTVVTDHRMAFSMSPQQTVLWDQIEYSGEPQDFAWVLPVMPGAQVQLSHDEFFAALDAVSDPIITGPSPQCGQRGGGGCGASAFGGGASSELSAGPGGGGGVQVVSQSVIGPYDTVTLHSTDPNALYDWLQANQYDLPDSIRPTVDAYVAGGFDFIALRLAPGQGVKAMLPVRVVSPGAALSLPLRMVAAGVGAQVGVTLYVLGEGRYEAQNFPNATFDDSKLVWLHAQNISNYQPLSQTIMQGGGGRTWLTEYSGRADLGSLACGSTSYSYSQTLGGLYFSQCHCDQPAGDAASDPSSCDAFDDLDVAFAGIDPQSAWITRMRALLPTNALAAGDLVLQASAPQSPVSNLHTAVVYDDPSYSPCGNSQPNGGACAAAPSGPSAWSRWLAAASLGLLGAAIVRRRARR